MFSRDPMIMRKGPRLGLLKRDPTKEELLERQRDPNRWWAARGKVQATHGRRDIDSVKGAQPDAWVEAPKCL